MGQIVPSGIGHAIKQYSGDINKNGFIGRQRYI